MSQPTVSVGILSATTVNFSLTGIYSTDDTAVITGPQSVTISESGLALEWNGRHYASLTFTPSSASGDHFTLDGVTIGIGFHWQRRECQQFRGALTLMVDSGKIVAINRVSVETYLSSVISSEMSSESPRHLLRAHAIISRSWLMSRIRDRHTRRHRHSHGQSALIRWWDHEDHTLFDVCADDHCQRYQGLLRVNEAAASAVADTKGIVLTSDGHTLCDTRFSKCCGGMMEIFSSCWEDTDSHPYLQGRRDDMMSETRPDLTDEASASRWILSRPEAFCSDVSPETLARVLNSYDRELPDSYRWTQYISQQEIVELLDTRSSISVGQVVDMIPLQRGTSGRIVMLRIIGTDSEVTIGKELMIRRTLSPSHLLSSAFTVERHFDPSSPTPHIPTGFTLHGAGWGHGVGLCQIGAAVMADRGYDYSTILSHYYPTSVITSLY